MTRQLTTATALADHAAEAIRALCHRTISDTLTTPVAYAVIGDLATLSHRLAQFTSQLGRGLQQRFTEPGYRLDHAGQDRWHDPNAAIATAVDALTAAARLAEQLSHQLDTAHAVTSHLIDGGPDHKTNRPEGQQWSNRHRRPRQAPPFHQTRRQPPRLYDIGWYGPDGEEIEVTIDLNDPNIPPFLVDQMTDNCPHCSGHHQEDDDDGD